MTKIVDGPQIDIAGHPDGVQWRAMIEAYSGGIPSIVIPVDKLDLMSDKEIADNVRSMVDVAWFVRALSEAEYFLSHASGGQGWQRRISNMADEDPESAQLLFRFRGRDKTITAAADMIEECQAYVSERRALKTKTPAVRRDIQSRYGDLFVKIGRRDGFTCAICKHTGGDLRIDHVHPVSKGGGNELTNLQLLCPPCNSRKSDHVAA